MARTCRCCLGWRGDRDCEGLSSLYSPDREYVLCEPCFEDEEALIDASGSNDHPEIVAAYRARSGTLALIRAALRAAA